MADFAGIDKNMVINVIVISDEDSGGGIYPESESIGQDFIASIGIDGLWLQTSPTGQYRGTYAGTGFTYDPDLDIFIAPKTQEVTK